ncbi:MAG: TlpA family protein disulfide reductase, partial [Gammaproteobacteria bacterium]|nr:TlpA family protein disulfide reductase [Gammaproteobacteria bacterium]
MKKFFLFLFVILSAVSFAVMAQSDLPKGIMKLDGHEAPSLRLKNLDEELFDINAAKGRWLFVHFWAAWCGPCRREMPTIEKIIRQFDPKVLQFVLVNTAETEETVFGFLG